MLYPGQTRILAVAIGLLITTAAGQAADDAKYPNWKGQWFADDPIFHGQLALVFDPTKNPGPAQQAPLTPEYQKVLEDSMADQAKGGIGNYPPAKCVPGGMPRMMALPTQEFVITPETVYILTDGSDYYRRIFTDGRDWPKDITPTYRGYSMGHWIAGNDGHLEVLEVETRGPFKGPRAYDGAGLPLHSDNQSSFKERIHLDKANPNILHDEITVFDHALTRPWSADKTYRHNPNPHPNWPESPCAEANATVVIGRENYFLSADGRLMPAKKDQAPPDLSYFKSPSTRP
jgi:hypothetical protein